MPLESIFTSPDIAAILLAIARAGSFACATPMLGLGEERVKARAVLAVLLALLILPSTVRAEWTGDWDELALRILIDAASGALVGLLLRCLVNVTTLVTQLIEQQLGWPITAVDEDEMPGTALGRLYQLTAAALFFSLGGHRLIVAALLDVAPPAAPPNWMLREVTERAATLLFANLALAVRLAAPVVLSLLVANLAVGMIARVMPQFAGLGAATPLLVGFGLVLVLMSLAATSTGLFEQLEWALRGPQPRA